MPKYKVEVGGYVDIYRQRTMTIYAKDEEEAKDKAISKFMEVQQERPGDMCSDGTVNSIELAK